MRLSCWLSGFVYNNIFEYQLEHLEEVFIWLAGAGFKDNASKIYFCRDDLEYLAYFFNRTGDSYHEKNRICNELENSWEAS
jgi:hypothetical protein